MPIYIKEHYEQYAKIN